MKISLNDKYYSTELFNEEQTQKWDQIVANRASEANHQYTLACVQTVGKILIKQLEEMLAAEEIENDTPEEEPVKKSKTKKVN